MVNADSNIHVYMRIILVSVLIAALGLFPSSEVFYSMLENAQKAAASGNWSSAGGYLEQAASQYPWRAELNVDAARYAFQGGDLKTAIELFELPGVKSRLDTGDLVLLGDAYEQTGNLSKAESTWKEAADSVNSPQAIQRLADYYIQRQDIPSALIYLKKLVIINPVDGMLYYRTGLLYAATDPEQSLSFLAQAADIDPSLSENASGLHDKIRTASLFDRPAYTLLVSGRELADINEWSLAANAFLRATELDPEYADAWALLGEAKQKTVPRGDSPSAVTGLAELQHALGLDTKSVLANSLMALYWERQKDYSQAQHYQEKAIINEPDNPYLYSELGNILSRAGDLPAAQTAFEDAIRHAPQDPTFYRLLAQFALENRIQTRELALPSARQALMLNPQDPASLDMMAQVMLELQDYQAVINYCNEALNADPNYIPAYLHLGTAYLYLGEPDLAYHWLGKAKDAGRDSTVANQAARMIDYYFPK